MDALTSYPALRNPTVPLGRPFLMALFFGSASLGCNPAPPPEEVDEGPELLLDRWVEMWNAYDLNQVEQLFLDDPGITYFSSEREGVIQGMEDLLGHHRGFGFVPGGEPSGSRLWLEQVTTDRFGSVAVSTGIWFFESADPSQALVQRGPVTAVSVRGPEGWRFVHMNFSAYPPP